MSITQGPHSMVWAVAQADAAAVHQTPGLMVGPPDAPVLHAHAADVAGSTPHLLSAARPCW